MPLGDGTAVETCATCDGAFFAKGDLARAVGTREDLRAAPPDDAPAERPCPACETVLLQRIPYARGFAITVERCPYCEGIFTHLPDLAQMRAIPAPRAPKPHSPPAPAAQPPEERVVFDPDLPPFTPLSPRQAALSLPIAVALSFAIHTSTFAKVVVGGARVPLHELGHATMAWLSGYSAVPVPFGVTLRSAERSAGVYAVIAVGIIAATWRLARARAFGWAALFAGLLVVQALCTWATTAHTRELLITFGGCAGELVYPAALVALFHLSLPHRLRWDMARWIALAIGAFILVDKTLDWRAARLDHDLIPWGSVMGEDGDMQRLERDHGWEPAVIAARYIRASYASWAIALAGWAAGFLRAWRARAA